MHDLDWKLYEDGRVYNIRTDPAEKSPSVAEDLRADVQERLRAFREVLDSRPADEDVLRLQSQMTD